MFGAEFESFQTKKNQSLELGSSPNSRSLSKMLSTNRRATVSTLRCPSIGQNIVGENAKNLKIFYNRTVSSSTSATPKAAEEVKVGCKCISAIYHYLQLAVTAIEKGEHASCFELRDRENPGRGG